MWVWKEGVLPQCVPHFIRLPCLVDMKERGMLRVKSSLILLLNLYCISIVNPCLDLICLACFVNCARHWGAWKEQLEIYLFFPPFFFLRAKVNMQISGSLYSIISGWWMRNTKPSLFKQYFTLYKSFEGSFAHCYWKTVFERKK